MAAYVRPGCGSPQAGEHVGGSGCPSWESVEEKGQGELLSFQEVRADCTGKMLGSWNACRTGVVAWVPLKFQIPWERGFSAAGLQPSGCLGPPVMVLRDTTKLWGGPGTIRLACHHPPKSRSVQVWSEWVLVCPFYTDSFITASRL